MNSYQASREESGRRIAANPANIERVDQTTWRVRSETSTLKWYRVRVNGDKLSCDCPDDYSKCKHVFAVEFTTSRAAEFDASMENYLDRAARHARELPEQARRLAADPANFQQNGSQWKVSAQDPSQPHRRWYTVTATARHYGCECYDCRGGHKCKHVLALELHLYEKFLAAPDPLPAEWINGELADEGGTTLQLSPHEYKGQRGWLLEHDPDYGEDGKLAEWIDADHIRQHVSFVIEQAARVGSLIFVKASERPSHKIAFETLQKLGFKQVIRGLLLFDPKSAPDPYAGIDEHISSFIVDTEEAIEQLVGSIGRGGTAGFYAHQTLRAFRERKREFLDKLLEKKSHHGM